MRKLVFLKLGGSLITDKTRPYTPRMEKMSDLAGQIASACSSDPQLDILLGHGSGSFGHTAASEHGTRLGVWNEAQWHGFSEVSFQAAALNRLLSETLHQVGLPTVTFPPSASVTSENGRIVSWDVKPIQAALAARLLPVIYGDVAFDVLRGGTILSTEDLFEHLAGVLHPQRILLAGMEEGVWGDFPAREQLLGEITADDFLHFEKNLSGAEGADVTGGMVGKVRQMLGLARRFPQVEIMIFSGEASGSLGQVLKGGKLGTRVRNSN